MSINRLPLGLWNSNGHHATVKHLYTIVCVNKDIGIGNFFSNSTEYHILLISYIYFAALLY